MNRQAAQDRIELGKHNQNMVGENISINGAKTAAGKIQFVCIFSYVLKLTAAIAVNLTIMSKIGKQGIIQMIIVMLDL